MVFLKIAKILVPKAMFCATIQIHHKMTRRKKRELAKNHLRIIFCIVEPRFFLQVNLFTTNNHSSAIIIHGTAISGTILGMHCIEWMLHSEFKVAANSSETESLELSELHVSNVLFRISISDIGCFKECES